MLSILFLPLTFLSFFNLIKGIKNYKDALGLHCLNITYFYIYGLGGLYSVFHYPNYLWLYSNFYRDDLYYALTALLVTLAYVVSYKSYFFINRFNLFKNKRKNISINLIKKSCNISLLMCCFFIYIYSSQYGGIYNALESAAAIRSGYGELEDGAKLTFVKYLMPIGVFPFLFYGYKTAIKPNISNILLWITSSSVVLLAFLLMSGRTRIVIYILAMVIIFIYSKRNVNFSIFKTLKYSPFLLVSVFVVMYGKIIFSSLGDILNGNKISSVIQNSEKKEYFLDSMIGYFCHRTYAIEAALLNFRDTNNVYWFKDNFMLPFYLIPERLTGIVKPDSISPYNTQILTGIYEGTIPPGILAYGVYSLWIPGIFISAIIYSSIFALVDIFFRKNISEKYILIIILPVIVVWGLYGTTGDFKIIVNSFSYILLFIGLLVFFKILSLVAKK